MEINTFFAARIAGGTGPGGVVADCWARTGKAENRAKQAKKQKPGQMRFMKLPPENQNTLNQAAWAAKKCSIFSSKIDCFESTKAPETLEGKKGGQGSIRIATWALVSNGTKWAILSKKIR